MAVQRFDFSALAGIDGGRIKEAWDQAMRRARADCADRPALDRPRKVVLITTLTPVRSPDGTLETVDVQFELDEAMPKRASAKYNMKAVPGGLLFNELSPEDVRQGTLDQCGPRGSLSDAQ